MYTAVIKIGNSQGIRIPKKIIEQCGIKNSLELTVKNSNIILTPINNTRDGWKEKFRILSQGQEDQELEFADVINNFDDEEWEW